MIIEIEKEKILLIPNEIKSSFKFIHELNTNYRRKIVQDYERLDDIGIADILQPAQSLKTI
jgi:hypothetical protein